MSSTCLHNMVNFGLLTAEIGWPVWGTPPNFNSLRVLAALLQSSKVSAKLCGIEQRAPPMFGRAGRPSRWALAHISSCYCYYHKNCTTVHRWFGEVVTLVRYRSFITMSSCCEFVMHKSIWSWSNCTRNMLVRNEADNYNGSANCLWWGKNDNNNNITT